MNHISARRTWLKYRFTALNLTAALVAVAVFIGVLWQQGVAQ